jgi:hypothetical protein
MSSKSLAAPRADGEGNMAYLSLYDTSLGVFDFDAIKDKGLEFHFALL